MRRVLLRAIRDVLVHGQVSQVPLLQGHTSPGLEPATPHSGEKRRVGHVGNEEVGGGVGGGGQRRMRASPGEALGDLHLKDPALAVGFDSAGGREGRGGSGGYTLNHLPRTIVQGFTPGFGYGLDEAKSPASRFFRAFAKMSRPISPQSIFAHLPAFRAQFSPRCHSPFPPVRSFFVLVFLTPVGIDPHGTRCDQRDGMCHRLAS